MSEMNMTWRIPARKVRVKEIPQDKYPASSMALMFFVFSAFGWLWEITLTLFTDGAVVNRGVLYGPWLPIYGVGGVAILLLLNRFRKNPVMVFGMGILVSGFMEYVTSWGLEHFFHTAWWDYSESFLNLNGRVCLLGLLCFAVGGSVVIHWAAPFLHRHIDRLLPKNQKMLLCGLLLLLFTVDIQSCLAAEPLLIR